MNNFVTICLGEAGMCMEIKKKILHAAFEIDSFDALDLYVTQHTCILAIPVIFIYA